MRFVATIPYLYIVSILVRAAAAFSGNDRPIIAIFTAPSIQSNPGCDGSCDYLAASYVKWIESAGGRAVPLPYNATNAYIDFIFGSVNGLVFPGGGAGISDSARYVFSKSVAANRVGDYFPVWGTCLGFEWLLQATAANTSVLDGEFDAENISLALDLTPEAATSRMFGGGQRLIQMLSNGANPPAMNNHVQGINTSHFLSTLALTSFYNVLSTNKDRNGREFISTIEGKVFPVYGTQWHPEKNAFEWGMDADGTPYEKINHSADAVAVAQALANFFIAEARKSNHHFASAAEEAKALIYNHPQSSNTSQSFVEEYFFHWPTNITKQGKLSTEQEAGLQIYERD